MPVCRAPVGLNAKQHCSPRHSGPASRSTHSTRTPLPLPPNWTKHCAGMSFGTALSAGSREWVGRVLPTQPFPWVACCVRLSTRCALRALVAVC